MTYNISHQLKRLWTWKTHNFIDMLCNFLQVRCRANFANLEQKFKTKKIIIQCKCIGKRQFHNLINNFNRWTLAKKNQWLPISRHYCHIPIMDIIVWLLAKLVIIWVSVDLLTVFVRLWNCVIIMWKKNQIHHL